MRVLVCRDDPRMPDGFPGEECRQHVELEPTTPRHSTPQKKTLPQKHVEKHMSKNTCRKNGYMSKSTPRHTPPQAPLLLLWAAIIAVYVLSLAELQGMAGPLAQLNMVRWNIYAQYKKLNIIRRGSREAACPEATDPLHRGR